MIKLKDGGPAFPSTISDDSLHVGGMTLRDYFAAKVIQGLVAGEINPKAKPEDFATVAYGLADAMLAAREG